MRLPKTAHTSQPWRIHEIAHDFTVEDVWALPTPGGPDDLPKLIDMFTSNDGPDGFSRITNALLELRWKIGGLLGLDKPEDGVGTRVPTLRDRLPADLRDGPRGPELGTDPFTSVYLTDSEYVAEMANKTVHGVLHLSWVPDGDGGYRGQMGVLVKPNGLFGTAYMAAILPFRYLIVYPAMLRGIRKRWAATYPNLRSVS
ncbi:uncharacterized protein DUF2867 [Herbihabitans rhizosphaerae]|uniref:Uncharacterized protein DUF2867 n=1 Tax=Herbihabitans rhizosphaerae TaxID=1872711 RepID=A0A4Q7L521_9PSEU|nr:DUF2867 domain-containing protein [Herbihabitans rhizosphaerae]RZS44739.1 uncharacterized protein DUF2867 [Herbihabitans rhizosphaerae]